MESTNEFLRSKMAVCSLLRAWWPGRLIWPPHGLSVQTVDSSASLLALIAAELAVVSIWVRRRPLLGGKRKWGYWLFF